MMLKKKDKLLSKNG